MVTIRVAKRGDCVAIMRLKEELAIHQNMKGRPMLSPESLEKDGFDSDPPAFHCFVAELENQVVGFALYFFAYAAFEGKVLHIEDLCVTQSLRKHGIGRRLLQTMAKVGLDAKCVRMQLEVLDWNTGAIQFYEKHGGINFTELEGWHDFEFDRKACESLVKQ